MLVVRVHAANVFGGKTARQVITNLFSSLHTVKKIWGDRAYSGAGLSNWALPQFECQFEVVRKKKGQRGFHVLPRRWVVERIFAWLSRWHRLSKDYERKPIPSETQVYFAFSRLFLRQICNDQTPYKMAVR